MRMRTASGLALASLATVASIVVADGHRAAPIRTSALDDAVIMVVDHGSAAAYDSAPWDCPETETAAG